jgi:hypothetical protein
MYDAIMEFMKTEIKEIGSATNVCCACVVTEASLQEFLILKATLEICHQKTFPWFIRCDEGACASLANVPEMRFHVFSATKSVRPVFTTDEFREIMSQKMNAMEDAWHEMNWDAVLSFDADIIVTKGFIPELLHLPQQVVLTPHHHPSVLRAQSIAIGRFNAGFVLTRSPEFHKWWREAYLANPNKFNEQYCLNHAPKVFAVATLDKRANVGWWRRTGITHFEPIPEDCSFLHVHLYQPLDSFDAFQQRSFALHCLEFLCNSQCPEHHKILETILRADSSGWYARALEEIQFLRRSRDLVLRSANSRS